MTKCLILGTQKISGTTKHYKISSGFLETELVYSLLELYGAVGESITRNIASEALRNVQLLHWDFQSIIQTFLQCRECSSG